MSKLLINESPILVLPTLAKKIGLNEALFMVYPSLICTKCTPIRKNIDQVKFG
ncbi:hypothetical protein [Caldibacillus sp. 210928-DFI.2.18]|uniref:hypothetical protein n=1 Tax=Caldibacillus sp. 210928-DFI.2.18 TaxID=2883264 RepID=UPI0035C813FF